MLQIPDSKILKITNFALTISSEAIPHRGITALEQHMQMLAQHPSRRCRSVAASTERYRLEALGVAEASADGECTAQVWQVPGYAGSVGFIASMTQPFCSSCNRLRLTADGNIKVPQPFILILCTLCNEICCPIPIINYDFFFICIIFFVEQIVFS